MCFVVLLCVILPLAQILARGDKESMESLNGQKVKPTSSGHLISFRNLSSKEIGFYYYNKYYEEESFFIEPQGLYTISLDAPSWIVQLDKFQTPYYLSLEQDSLDIRADKNSIAQISLRNSLNPTAQNELNAFAYVSANMPKSENQMWIDIIRKNNYAEADKLILEKYHKSKGLFLEYQKNHKLSAQFEELANTKMILDLYSYQLFFGANSTKKIIVPGNYKQYIDSIANLILSGSIDIGYGYPAHNFDYKLFNYEFREKFGSKATLELKYSIALKEFKQSKRLDKILFFIAKDGLADVLDSVPDYIKNFLTDCGDNDYKDYITERIADIQYRKSIVGSNEFFTRSATRFSYTDILKNNLGKIIYIDIWASWCVPCRKEMPASLKLQDLYKDKPIEFVFVSIDKETRAWKKACIAEKLDKVKSNYYILMLKNLISTKSSISKQSQDISL